MKIGRDNDSFAIIQSAKKLFQKGNLENKRVILTFLELTFAHKALVLIPKHFRDVTDFFQDISVILLCQELTFAHEALVLIPKHFGDITNFFRDICFRQRNITTVSSAAQMEGVYFVIFFVTPMFVSASQNKTLEKPLWRWRISPAATVSNQ